MEIRDVLNTIASQLRIVRTNPIDFSQSIRVEPGKLLSFGISSWLSQQSEIKDKGLIDLTGDPTSSLRGPIPLVQKIPISLEVTWSIQDERGNNTQEGDTFLAPDGLNGFQASFIFIPSCIVELTNDPHMLSTYSPKRYNLIANVILRAGKVVNEEGEEEEIVLQVNLPSVPILVLPMAVPTIFTVFSNRHFTTIESDCYHSSERQGEVLVLVPPNSPLRSIENMLQLISNLKDKASALSTLPDFFLFKLGLETLYDALQSNCEIQFRVGIDFKLKCIQSCNQGWQDKINSFIFIGSPGQTIQCFNYDHPASTDKGMFTLTINSLHKNCYALARKLDSANPDTEPFHNEIIVNTNPENSDDTFSKHLHRIKFGEINVQPSC
ncbi:hypothetical protein MOE39_05010 [Bacillus cereus]|uniref:hypothetical protein n=1 Tax=Bacillus cereus TaxID=1396 RepID=UPI00227E55AA|nr:hypothetical protein [Bacillus cereus]